jgi:outer membrane protein assembly factor BamB
MALAMGLLAGCGGDDDGDGGGGGARVESGKGNDPDLVSWPTFGRVPERVHYLPTDRRELDPPLREAWSINTHGLIEFPPAVAGGVAYLVNKFGNLHAIRLRDHATLWKRDRDPKNKGEPTDVTAPEHADGKVFIAYLDGEMVALQAKTGKPAWKRHLPGELESSPMVTGGILYIGTDKQDLLALRASNGKTVWKYHASGPIKASPSHHDGRVYFADYRGTMYALDAKTGKEEWRTDTTKQKPFGSGGFYSSPGIDFGHVYAARDDGTVYAFDEGSGKIEWFFQTHDFIYGSPALAEVPGTPPTVYIGSYDKYLYALNALNGRQRWKFNVKGPIPGTATVIGNTVYTSSFRTREAVGIDVHTHRKTFGLDSAGYTPVVSDGEKVFLVGYFELIGLEPKRG